MPRRPRRLAALALCAAVMAAIVTGAAAPMGTTASSPGSEREVITRSADGPVARSAPSPRPLLVAVLGAATVLPVPLLRSVPAAVARPLSTCARAGAASRGPPAVRAT